MIKKKIKRAFDILDHYLHPKRAIRSTSIALLRILNRYGNVESMQSLEKFNHPKQLKNFKILSSDFGQFETIKNWDCIDPDSEKIPWYTYSAYEFINSLDLSDLKITEFGSGNSSLFYLRKGSVLTSIESDAEWHDRIGKVASDAENFTYRLCLDEKSYTEQGSIKEADVIIIDGRYRNACARIVCDHISKNQSDPYMIIFDNSDWYSETIRSISERLKWQRVDFSGFGPINNYCWTTSIFFNPQKRLIGSADIKPIAGLERSPPDDIYFE